MNSNTAIRLQLTLARDILRNAYAQFDRDRIPEVAGGAAFFILLALFPAFAAIVTLYGLFADRATIAHELAQISPFLPRGALVVLNAELHRQIERGLPQLGVTFLISTTIALWSASGGLKALVHGLNVAYEVRETRGFLRLSAIALLFTAVAIVFCVLAIGLAALMPLVARQLHFHGLLREILPIVSWPLAYWFALMVLAAVYTFGPNGRRPWKPFSWGAGVAAGLWLSGTFIFKWYVHNFGSFDRIYGSLGAAIGFLTWIWISIVIILFGAELNRELERRSRILGR